jgi:hypothetical protein
VAAAPRSWLLSTNSSDPVDGARMTALAAERQPAAGIGGQLRFVRSSGDSGAGHHFCI